MNPATSQLTPREIVSELDKFIIGQKDAKRAVAIALRNRWRRLQVPEELRDEIAPKNIIMIGPTGVGKTEIARRLAKLAMAPFIKVEASKFTEVGYVGKDVESMIRELTELAVKMIREEEQERVQARAQELGQERLLDLLLPKKDDDPKNSSANKKPQNKNPLETLLGNLGNLGNLGGLSGLASSFSSSFSMTGEETPPETASAEEAFASEKEKEKENESEEANKEEAPPQYTREELREMLRRGELDDQFVELELSSQPFQMIEVIAPGGFEDMGANLKEMFGQMMPKQRKKRKVKVPEALKILIQEELSRLVDMEAVVKIAVKRVEENGIVFLDEIDKIAGRESHGPDVSREGVQRDILPIVEGSTVSTKYGMVKTDHILFIAAGAFHVSKPSDLIPELQGRFPIRVELQSLTKDDFLKILIEPQNSLTRQYMELLKTESLNVKFSQEALEEISNFAATVNERTENIGARRLHTIMEKLLEEISFDAPELEEKKISIDAKYVKDKLTHLVKDVDLSRYIL